MSKVVIYYNPGCQTCRSTKELIDANADAEVEVIEYLKNPLTEGELRQLLAQLQMEPLELIREKNHAALDLPPTSDKEELIKRMVEHPEIIQRPIVIVDDSAKVCRPAQSVLDILPKASE